jgi:spore coat protein A
VTWKLGLRDAFAFFQSNSLQKFAQPLRGVGPGEIPVAAPDPGPAPVTGATHYRVTIAQFTDRLHPLRDCCALWCYVAGSANCRTTLN